MSSFHVRSLQYIEGFPSSGIFVSRRFRKCLSRSASTDSTVGQQIYKRSTHPTSVPLSKLFSSQFPLSTKESFRDYAFRHNPLKFQWDLLSTLPFFPNADAQGRRGHVVETTLSSGHRINEFVIHPPSFNGKAQVEQDALYENCNHLIMVHGYGGGLGFFLKNFDQVASLPNWVVHSVDLLGYGCSSRPKFTPTCLDEVEDWFHDSFQEWLNLRHLNKAPEKNLVMAHSMGAYLMATYGIRRDPSFCKKMLMVSPGAIIKHRRKVPVPAYFARLWEQNISPFSLVRNAGPLGSKLVSMWSSRRFANLPAKEAKLLHKYAYGIFQSPGSGEYMLNYLLAPGADARHPLIERGVEALKCRLLWCYGKEDWMDRKGGELCSAMINEHYGDPTRSSTCEIENAGHHLYLDNIRDFNKLLLTEMKNF
ncbi:putative cardiolipin-specific deacylase [Clavispora lusitaniae]|uniref:Cardiolipin-specific deacylase n=1 Tax=Clavispora lusitaniae TaxID=36911 RepID=A0ACD0WFV9_CLALS|nr:hypothetical protein E0198_001739 [Clavispora lusitaniae]QFZ26449.1 putative cardiolipin-specific deacylase [Clavispora lusitaniae]QFZ32117.1 putative cardiolipin-specific deacylase [Clavispora lusitaniae]QFZ37786.1 putative cardiolipin-specific deacylase [Clavispora lusitaniae]QFZ43470.1 putative cardiolipin-specific deacylase [Clavispora lusitaniae]